MKTLIFDLSRLYSVAVRKGLRLFTTLLLSFVFLDLFSQVPQGFNYQAIAKDGSGNSIQNQTLQIEITIQSDSLGGTTFWQELHSGITTNVNGMFGIIVGKGTRQNVSTVLTFNDIDWTVTPKFISTRINYNGWKPMGSSRLWTVPYATMAGNISGALKKLAVTGNTTNMDEALFEVKNNTGQTVFAVYNEGVRVYVDNGNAKGAKGGFAIGGFGTTKAGVSQNLLTVSPDSVRIYVDETVAKGAKGGFAIGGFNTNKGTIKEFMMMTPENYFIGHNSGISINTGIYNSTLGYESGKALIGGSNNVLLGYRSGITTSGGSNNVFIGTEAGYLNSSGNYNIVLGRQAGYNSSTSSSNIFLGDLTAYFNTIGDQNVMIGDWAGYHNTEGYQNVFLGANAGWYNTTGSNNIFVGFESGYNNTTGFDNITLGNKAGHSNLDGTYNVMIGSDAGSSNVSGDYNTLVGYKSGEKTTSDYGTMLGYLAGNSTISGASQTMLGYMAGAYNTGSYNTYVGTLAGGNSSTGADNTYVGLAAGNNATGDRNVFLGKWAGYNETGSDKLVISNNYSLADNLNNALVFGDFAAKYFKINGQIFSSVNKTSGYAAEFENFGGTASNYGVNVSAGSTDGSGLNNYLIDFNSGNGTWKGSIMIVNGVVGLYQASDARLKENILNSGVSAMKLLNDLKVMDFNYTKSPGATHIGYIAQDVQKVFPEMVIYNKKADVYAISTTALIPVLHKAITEQQQLIDSQQTEIDLLKTELNQIKTLLQTNGIK